MNISTLNKTARLEIEYNGEKVWFQCKTNALTPRFLDQVSNIQTDVKLLAKALASVVTEWDINLDGQPFPPTEENLLDVPTPFLTTMIEKMTEVWGGDVGKPLASASTSAATGS